MEDKTLSFVFNLLLAHEIEALQFRPSIKYFTSDLTVTCYLSQMECNESYSPLFLFSRPDEVTEIIKL